MSKSAVLTDYQYDLAISKIEAKKFLKIIERESNDILDDYNKHPWLRKALDELYAQFLTGRKIRRSDLERFKPIGS